MKKKKTSIKIKHHKYNLYNKKKSKTRRVLTVIGTIAAACALGILGYGLGKPLVNYFRNPDQYISDSEAWTPPNTADSSDSPADSDTESGSGNSTSADEPNSKPVEVDNTGIYTLPAKAAVNSAALDSALAAAKESGCSTVAVILKDNAGNFLYKTSIAGIKDGDTITGAMTAEQICEAITNAGFTPAAKISTLMDSSSPRLISGGYELATGDGYWLDAAPSKGGKQWLSPFRSETVKFIGDITSELSQAGFKHIICTNTRFPAFYNSDIKSYLSNLPLTDSAKRVSALWNVINSAQSGCEKHGATLWLQINGDSITAEQKNSTDAEITLAADKIKDQRIIVSYSLTAGDAYQTAKDFADKVTAATHGASVAVSVKAGASSSALEGARKAFTEAGFDIFIES